MKSPLSAFDAPFVGLCARILIQGEVAVGAVAAGLAFVGQVRHGPNRSIYFDRRGYGGVLMPGMPIVMWDVSLCSFHYPCARVKVEAGDGAQEMRAVKIILTAGSLLPPKIA